MPEDALHPEPDYEVEDVAERKRLHRERAGATRDSPRPADARSDGRRSRSSSSPRSIVAAVESA
eukprot:5458362-Pyramimonas_sp.AAC.1